MSEDRKFVEIPVKGTGDEEDVISLTFSELEVLLEAASNAGWAMGAAGEDRPEFLLKDMRRAEDRGRPVKPLTDVGIALKRGGDG